MYTKCLVLELYKNDLIYLKNNGAARCHYTPLSLQPLFKQWGLNCPYFEKEIDRCITLPLHPDLKSNEVEYIISLLESFYERNNFKGTICSW